MTTNKFKEGDIVRLKGHEKSPNLTVYIIGFIRHEGDGIHCHFWENTSKRFVKHLFEENQLELVPESEINKPLNQ